MVSKYLEWIEEANDRQLDILDRKNHCIVKAGPGTGKTRTLVLKAATLLYEEIFPPRGLACVTYTQAMANELRERLLELGVSPQHNVFIGTLHGFCLTYILSPFAKKFDFPLPHPIKILSASDQAQIYSEIWDSFEERHVLNGYEPEYRDGELVERLPIAFQKYRRTQLDGVDSKGFHPLVEQLVNQYEKALSELKSVDFDLLVKWSMQLVEQQPYVHKALEAKFPWLLIDEYQDVGLPLHRMVKALTRNTEIKLFAIGDTNQCIYGFSGASPQYLDELFSDTDLYGEPITLSENYRSYSQILQAAEIVALETITLTPTRLDNIGIVSFHGGNQLINILKVLIDDAKLLPSEVMILHPWRSGCATIASVIEAAQIDIPYFNSVQEIYDYRRPLLDWIGKLMSFTLSLVQDEIRRGNFQQLCSLWQMLLTTSGLSQYDAVSLKNRLSLFRALQKSVNKVNDAYDWLKLLNEDLQLDVLFENYLLKAPDEVAEYEKLMEALHPDGVLSGLSLAEVQNRIERKNRVYIGTLHSSKGQQNKAVILANSEALNVGGNTVEQLERQDENRRLFYVGVTRAMDKLYITSNSYSYLANYLEQNLAKIDINQVVS